MNRISYKLAAALLVVIVTMANLALPAFAKAKQKYSVVQQGQTPSFMITNNTKRSRIVDVQLALSNSKGTIRITQTYGNQTIAPGASQVYSFGQLTLSPDSSPYRIAVSIYNVNKKHKLIEKVDPAGWFTAVH